MAVPACLQRLRGCEKYLMVGLWAVPYAGIVATVTQCQLWGKPFLLVDKSGVVDKVRLDDKVVVVKVGLVDKIGLVDTVGLVDK